MDIYIIEMRVLLRYFVVVVVVVVGSEAMQVNRNLKSQWDPFCKASILYKPYVRVYWRGRNGRLLKERGPGFIDVSKLDDVYICSNGVRLLYYAKTAKFGDLYEGGELQWAAHHCELYNPSRSSAMKRDKLPPDMPSKRLLGLLLIGHPSDYRLPALQMFVHPNFDQLDFKYENVTSLVMISSDGECIIEKGNERARIRVRGVPPESVEKGDKRDRPTTFCRLDAARQLGQEGTDTVALETLPDWMAGKHALKAAGNPNPTPPLPHLGGGAPLDKDDDMPEPPPMVKPPLPEQPLYADPETGKVDMKIVAAGVLDQLTHDKPLRFVGCLKYPPYNKEVERIVYDRWRVTQSADFGVDKNKFLSPKDTDDWWKERPFGNRTRFAIYEVDEPAEDYLTMFNALIEARENLALAPKKTAKLKNAYNEVNREFTLFCYHYVYRALYEVLTEDLELPLIKAWEEVKNAIESDQTVDNGTGLSINSTMHAFDKSVKDLSEALHLSRVDGYDNGRLSVISNYTSRSDALGELRRVGGVILGPILSRAETLWSRYHLYLRHTDRAMRAFVSAIKEWELTGSVKPCVQGEVLSLDTFVEIKNPAITKEGDVGAACYRLPPFRSSCGEVRPGSKRAFSLFNMRKGKGSVEEWGDGNEWRGEVVSVINQVFCKVCPYISERVVTGLGDVLKGYLLGLVLGTGLLDPVDGSRVEAAGGMLVGVYNNTYDSLGVKGLSKMDPFWGVILSVLRNCSSSGGSKPIQFWDVEDSESSGYSYVHVVREHLNGTREEVKVDRLVMDEMADYEYEFNWAIDSYWRVFSTVLGTCMPAREDAIPLVSARFYALFTRDFLSPLRQVWMSNRDNPIFRVIFGDYFSNGKMDKWTRNCMESSFFLSGDLHYRPVRNLYVNAFTEMNYFTSGPMVGTPGVLAQSI